jgi:hypothetical protein
MCFQPSGAMWAKSSITHLTFNRNTPLARKIEAYQRHRNKKLKQQQGRFS